FVEPDQVSAYFSAVDVGLCPYEKHEGSDAQTPMRLLSYTAAGCAVVSTALEEVQRMRLPNVVLVGDSASEMAAGIRQALQLPRRRPPEIDDYDVGVLTHQYEDVLAGVPVVSG